MMDFFTFFAKYLTDIIKIPFSWYIMPNISLGMFIIFFCVLGLIIMLLLNTVLKRGGRE